MEDPRIVEWLRDLYEHGRDGEAAWAGGYAIVQDADGVWPWYRRDYPEIRTLIELGYDIAFDYSHPTR